MLLINFRPNFIESFKYQAMEQSFNYIDNKILFVDVD